MKKIILLTAFIIAGLSLFAQQGIEGKILDESGEPLVGAHIENLFSGTHAHSSDVGSFYLENTKSTDSIKINFIGYESLLSIAGNKEFILISSALNLDEVSVSKTLDPFNLVSKLDVQLTPIASSQEVLSTVPGLFIGQHAGGGKAEQIFLRGFDIDHGTDLAITVDGMPVNMVSHAHGQGYADLHFVIPELVNAIDFGKGPYDANIGNFGTAGYVNLRTKDRLKSSSIQAEAGMFGTKRLVGMLNLLPKQRNQSAYLALEHKYADGPFESSQFFNRTNIVGKYVNYFDGKSKLSLTASHFTSNWDASGQIPQRAVDAGTISRFGAIDNTEGGETSRTNLQADFYKQINKNTFSKTNVYLTHYDFLLFSNFTFFLEDSVNGDQIKQYEDRFMYGLNSSVVNSKDLGEVELTSEFGISLRSDYSRGNELSKTMNRSTTQYFIQRGDVQETNYGAYASTNIEYRKFSIEPSVRVDEFLFQYVDALAPIYTKLNQRKAVVSPKIKALYTLDNVQLYAKSGIGFHSNDSRVVLMHEADDILPRAFGNDLGFIYKKGNLLLNAALWNLYLEQEFVYVGDAGIVEPSGKTKRQGVDLGLRYQLTSYLFASADGTYTLARSTEDNEGENYIPLAPKHTGVFTLGLKDWNNWNATVNGRYLGDRPANEDYSITAEGYTVLDANVNYTWKKLTLGVQLQNITNTEWNETQFATESRLRNESQSVEEIHFTPGTPFGALGTVRWAF